VPHHVAADAGTVVLQIGRARQWVAWGDRTVDEMAHARVDVTCLDQEEFDRLTAERKAKAAERKKQ
jgi:hypothetical protein